MYPKDTTEIIGYGIDDTGTRTHYVRRNGQACRVETGHGWSTISHQRSPVARWTDMSDRLRVLPYRTHEGAIRVAVAILEGRAPASVNQEAA